MPTGYTADIVDGKINEFSEFAKRCIRHFGVAIHQKDEPMDVPYKPRKVDINYYKNSLKRALKERDELSKKTNKQLVEEEKKRLIEQSKYYINTISERIEVEKRLLMILRDVKEWTPPTKEHQNFKDFMIEQLNITIDYDGDSSYFIRNLIENENALKEGINPWKIRHQKIKQINRDIQYYQNHIWDEVNRVASSNKWGEELFNTLKKI